MVDQQIWVEHQPTNSKLTLDLTISGCFRSQKEKNFSQFTNVTNHQWTRFNSLHRELESSKRTRSSTSIPQPNSPGFDFLNGYSPWTWLNGAEITHIHCRQFIFKTSRNLLVTFLVLRFQTVWIFFRTSLVCLSWEMSCVEMLSSERVSKWSCWKFISLRRRKRSKRIKSFFPYFSKKTEHHTHQKMKG